eukprot:scpid87973/ scgid2446/ 
MAIEAIGRLADLHIADDLEGKLRLFGQYDSVHDDLKTKGLSALFCGGSSQSVQQDAATVVEDVESDIDSICSAWRQQGQYDRANELQAQVSLFKKLSSEGTSACTTIYLYLFSILDVRHQIVLKPKPRKYFTEIWH